MIQSVRVVLVCDGVEFYAHTKMRRRVDIHTTKHVYIYIRTIKQVWIVLIKVWVEGLLCMKMGRQGGGW